MAVTKILARSWDFYVEDKDSGDFVPIKGINSFTINPTKTDADVGDFDSEGMAEHLPAERAVSITLQGVFLIDRATGDRDPGQQLCEELSEKVDIDGLAKFRFIPKTATEGWEFLASFSAGPTGGGRNDGTGWQCEVTRTGKTTKFTRTP